MRIPKIIFILLIFCSANIYADSILKFENNNYKKNISKYIIYKYFILSPGENYSSLDQMIKSNKLRYIKGEDQIQVLGGFNKNKNIKYLNYYIKDDLITQITLLIDEPMPYLHYIYNDLKDYININYNEDRKSAIYIDSDITLELKYYKENKNSKNYIYLSIYLNNYYHLNSAEKYKSVGFSAGMGISFYFNNAPTYSGAVSGWEISFPINFSYYFSSRAGIGFTYKPSLSYCIPISSNQLTINNSLSVSHKFGRIHNYYVVFEYGVNFQLKIPFFVKRNLWFLPGPTFYIGFEKYTRKNISISIGFFTTLGINKIRIYSSSYNDEETGEYVHDYDTEKTFMAEMMYVNVRAGFEFSVKFDFRRTIKSKDSNNEN